MDLSKLRFRHVFGEAQKQKYENILSSAMTLESCGIKGNPYYCAFTWKTSGGGALCILDNNKPEKLSSVPPMIVGHQGAVLDFDFHPFNDYYIATASDDNEIRLWELPLEMTEDIKTPVIQLSGHQKRVQLLQFNHTSNNILCSSSADLTIKVWNLEKSQDNLTIPVPEAATSLTWNYQGNLLGMTHKDKFMRILDPRVGQFAGKIKCHEGPKSQKFSWMGNTDYCITTGFSKKFDRQFNLWDMRNLDAPVQTQNIDNSSGVIFPFYDYDSGLLFLAGKGDGNIRFYEFYDGQFFKCSNSYSTNKSGMAHGFYSKRSVNVLKHELMRGIKLTDSTVEFISFCAPRKAEGFQEDLYPKTIGNIPAQSGEDWFMGQTKPPVLISMAPECGRKTIQSKQVQMTLQNIKLQSEQSQQFSTGQEQVLPDANYLKQLQDKYEKTKTENNDLRDQQRDQTIQIDSLENELSILSQQQQQQKENEQQNEMLDQQQAQIQKLEEQILSMTNTLDINDTEGNQIQEQINCITNETNQISSTLEFQQNQLKELEESEQEKQQQRQNEEEAESEELKEQKQLFQKIRLENKELKEQLEVLKREQQEKKQNEEYQQVIQILLNQEDKFVNELSSFMIDRKGALAAIKQSM